MYSLPWVSAHLLFSLLQVEEESRVLGFTYGVSSAVPRQLAISFTGTMTK
jgi:hypothetical protein